jgi:hypothetical protein
MSKRLSVLLCLILVSAVTVSAAPPEEAKVKPQAERVLVAIDPETGQLRQPTAAEAAHLIATNQFVAISARVFEPRVLATGATFMALDASTDNVYLATTDADGQAVLTCVQGVNEAATALNVEPQSIIRLRPRSSSVAAERE